MSKDTFGLPIILLSGGGLGDGDETEEPVGGSSHGGFGPTNGGNKIPFACSFDSWQEYFHSDNCKDGKIDFNDYGQWWADSGLGKDAWEQFNAGVPFTWESKQN